MDWLVGGPLGAGGSLQLGASGWQLALIVLGLVLTLGAAVRRRGASRAPELALLAVALLALGAALAQPSWVESAGREEPGVLAILIDDSRSMSVLESGQPRSVQVADALAQSQTGRTEVFTFGERLGVGQGSEAGKGGYEQNGSDLGGALQALSERYAGERLAGIVVISDGLDRGGLRERVMGTPSPRPLELQGPLTLYQVGRAGELSDLAVVSIDSGGYAFENTPFSVTARIHGAGYEGRPVPVTLSRDGEVVASKTLTLDSAGLGELRFDLEQARPGRFIYQVSVPAWEGDAVPGNNSLPLSMRVVRDKIRVLQVCGGPSFDQKFLRLFLKQDPSVDLVSFFILRTPEDVNQSRYHETELSLISFPYMSLFTREELDGELDEFDMVIFQNFDYAPYFRREKDILLGQVADYVKDGGSFVMIGGDKSFDLAEYHGTPLGDVLPVTLGLSPAASTDLASFSPELSEMGRVHPVTRLLGNAQENELLWERLPPLDGLNLSAGLAPGSAALLVHPTLTTAAGEPMPVVAVREVGRGRTMALMGDSSWRWVMAEAADGNGNQAYLRFWKNSMRWLMQERDGQRVVVESTRDNLRIGETVRLVARVRDVGFEPIEGVLVRGEVQGPDGIRAVEAVTNSAGEAIIELPASGAGAYQVRVQAGDEGALGKDSTSFAVSARDPELDEILPDGAFLRAFASLQGATFYAPGAYGPPTLDPKAGRVVDEEKTTPLGSAPILALLVGLGLGGSWLLRRLAGGK